MTRKEFENLTKRIIAPEDYRLIENLYMAAGEMGKVEFCKEIRIMCAYDGANDRIEIRRCLKELGKRVGTMDAELNFLKRETKRKHAELAEILIGKACAYQDTDLYREAVRLIGQREVTLTKLRMDLPLWDEDKQYIEDTLKVMA